jgi:O-antigen ligase
VVYFAVYLTLANSLARDDVNSVWRALERTVLAFALFGIFQSIFLPGFAQMVYPESRIYADWDPQGHRLVSTLLDPNFAGGLLMMVLLVQLGHLASGATVPRWKPMVLFAAVVMTASRSSLIALFVGGVLIVAVRGVSRRLLQLAGVAAVLLAVFAPALIEFARKLNKLTVDASALQRVAQWARGLRVFADHPFIGIGFNTWGYVSERYGYARLFASSYAIDGGLLFVAVMTGIVGLGLYLAMVFFVWRRSCRIWRDVAMSPETRGLALGVAAATVALCVHSLFTNSLLLPILMEVLWVLWALVFVMSRPSPTVE